MIELAVIMTYLAPFLVGAASGIAGLKVYLKKKAANLTDEELNVLFEMLTAAMSDGKITRDEVLSFVKTLLKFTAD